MLKKEQIERNGCDIEESEEYGYIANDLSKTLTLDGKTKMCSYYKDLNSGVVHSELLPTFDSEDVIPTAEMRIQAYMDEGKNGVFYRTLWSGKNNTLEFAQVKEGLGIVDYSDCTVYGNNPEIARLFQEDGYLLKEDMASNEVEAQITPLTMVYSTALPREENEKLILGYFDVLSSIDQFTEVIIENFFSYHKGDLIDCFGGKDQLLEFINTRFTLDDKSRSELEQDIRSYSPQEIVDGINVRQGELGVVIGETADILNEKNNDRENYGFSHVDE